MDNTLLRKLLLFTIPISVTGILLNILLLAFSLRHKVASSSATALVRSQAIIDTLVLVANVTFLQLQLVPYPASSDAVSLHWFAYCILGSESTLLVWMLVDFSIYNTLASSLERCLCICANFWWKRHKRTAVRLFYLCIFVSTNLAYVPQNLLSTWPTLVPTDSENSTGNATIVCDSRHLAPRMLLRTISVVSISVTMFIPVTGMLCCYAAILMQLRKSAAISSSSRRSEAASRRFTLIVGLTVLAFIACNTPDCVRYMMWNFGANPEVTLSAVVTVVLLPQLAIFNSVVNPLIYLLFHRQFTRFVFCRHISGGGGSGVSRGARTGSSLESTEIK